MILAGGIQVWDTMEGQRQEVLKDSTVTGVPQISNWGDWSFDRATPWLGLGQQSYGPQYIKCNVPAHLPAASHQPLLPSSLRGDVRTSHPWPPSSSLPLTEMYCNHFSPLWDDCKSGALPQTWTNSMDPQTPRKVFLATAHSQENTTYTTQHPTNKRNRVTFQPATLPPSAELKAKCRKKLGNSQTSLHSLRVFAAHHPDRPRYAAKTDGYFSQVFQGY